MPKSVPPLQLGPGETARSFLRNASFSKTRRRRSHVLSFFYFRWCSGRVVMEGKFLGIKRGEGDKKDYHKRSMSGDFFERAVGGMGREGRGRHL